MYHKGLLKFAVSAEALRDTLAVFVADMSRPWTIMESLQKWASVLRDHVDRLKIPPEEMREMEQKSEYRRRCPGGPQHVKPLLGPNVFLEHCTCFI